MSRLKPQEKEDLLQKRAARELEAAGYGMKHLEDGSFIVFSPKSGKTLAQFEDIIQLGQVFGLWGEDGSSDDPIDPPARDPKTGKDSPDLAAVREKLKITAPAQKTPNKGRQPSGKASREAHRR